MKNLLSEKISKKEYSFCENYIKLNYDLIKTAEETGMSSYKAKKLLSTDKIKKLIEEINEIAKKELEVELERQILSKNQCLVELSKIAVDVQEQTKNRIAAINSVSKISGYDAPSKFEIETKSVIVIE